MEDQEDCRLDTEKKKKKSISRRPSGLRKSTNPDNSLGLRTSLQPFIDMTNVFNLFPDALFIVFNLRKLDEKMISSFENSISKFSPNKS